MVVAYSIVLILVEITTVNNALGGRLYWAIFVVVAILEPSVGEPVRCACYATSCHDMHEGTTLPMGQ